MSSAPPQPPRVGLFDSLGRLLATSVGVIHNRLALLTNDVQVSAVRLFDALVLALIGLAAVGIGSVLLCGWVLLLVDPGYRALAAGLMTLCFLGGGLGALWFARTRLRQAGGAFEATRAELERDLAALRSVER
ncbi:MAG: phage holin family protein [Rubrivivax sp.]